MYTHTLAHTHTLQPGGLQSAVEGGAGEKSEAAGHGEVGKHISTHACTCTLCTCKSEFGYFLPLFAVVILGFASLNWS